MEFKVSQNGFRTAIGMIALGLGLSSYALAAKHAAVSADGMVATVNPYATDAGVRALEAGGNAVDAAVAAALMLGVVDTHNSGLGGGCFVLIRRADGTLVAIDGREMAPAGATRDMFLRDGKAVPELSVDGPLAVAVPGALAAYDRALRAHGSLTLSELIGWATERAEEGFSVDRVYAANIARIETKLDAFPGLRAKLLRADGTPYRTGDTLVQPDLARSYRAIADQGLEWFYIGEFAQRVAKWMAENGGLITEQDFAKYQSKVRIPIESSYRGYTIVGFPPPSSGGIHVAQILNILEHFDLQQIHREDPDQAAHIILEAMKLAFADRAHWLGDADFALVPKGLIDRSYATELASRIQVGRAIEVNSHGTPSDWDTNTFGKHTTHIAAADREGNWVGITATINVTYGSKVVVPGTGIVLNNEMDDFSAQPGMPNAFGLVGAENNAVEPGKRPLSSMSPTIVMRDGKPVMTVGAAGGPKIITQVVLAIVRHLDYGLSLEEALRQPRFHHQWVPGYVRVEATYSKKSRSALADYGHEVRPIIGGGVSQAIGQLEDGCFIGVHDPRVPGKASGPTRVPQATLEPAAASTP